MKPPNQVSEAVRKLNPSIYGGAQADPLVNAITLLEKSKRIRQDQKPLMNKLESDWLNHLRTILPAGTLIHSQSWRVKIANGAWFKVDHCAFVAGRWMAWECKGPKQGKNVARGMLALKCAASSFPDVDWILVWREAGQWRTQKVIP